MAKDGKLADSQEIKAVGWKIPEPLRRGLNSHSEYLSIENETSTDAMVALWLSERLKVEEKARALRTLGLNEKDLPRK
jgi:hypothetical protein